MNTWKCPPPRSRSVSYTHLDPGKDAAGDKGAQHQNQVGRTADDNIDNRLLGSHNRGSLRVIMRSDRRV